MPMFIRYLSALLNFERILKVYFLISFNLFKIQMRSRCSDLIEIRKYYDKNPEVLVRIK